MKRQDCVRGVIALLLGGGLVSVHLALPAAAEEVPPPPTPTCIATDPACDWPNGGGGGGHIGEGSVGHERIFRWNSEPTPTPTPPPCDPSDPACDWPNGGGGGGHIGEG